MRFLERFGKEMLLFDGAMGTQLQAHGLQAGELPELWNIQRPETVAEIHRAYVQAGCDILKTNTFGANALKFSAPPYTAEAVVKAGVQIARKTAAAAERDIFVALDMGPTGKLLEPCGALSFAAAYELYRTQISAGAADADLVLIETMGDLYECKAAVLAAKENCSLPVVVTLIFDKSGKLLTGADLETAVYTLESFGVDALGFNCGLGPAQMLPLATAAAKIASIPLVVNPNAGLPVVVDGETTFPLSPPAFAQELDAIAGVDGVWAVGGCCGTSPAHLAAAKICRGHIPASVTPKTETAVTSYGKTVRFGNKPVLIGERINPTGKKRLKAALLAGDEAYILEQAAQQIDCGAQILDVNVGLPELDEPAVLAKTVQSIQGITDLPLELDTSDSAAMERALRIYNGKPLLNSVNGEASSMQAVFPLAKKYGAAVVCLTLDEHGIPETAAGRVAIAERILKTAAQYGIAKKDLLVDPLAMTVSTGAQNAQIALDALREIRGRLGVHTVLGVSNISFGLPNRAQINAAFFTLAMENGLSAGIVNPKSDAMLQAYYAYCALKDLDANFEQYIAHATEGETLAPTQTGDLKAAVQRGLQAQAAEQARALLETVPPLQIIDSMLIPALDAVGRGFESGTVFLPQLLRSADAAKAAFAELKAAMQIDKTARQGEKIVLATVKGDIHDIGKNIVKVLLENYGFTVLDLGKDVEPSAVLETVQREQVRLVGLSALMTTTVVAMEKTVALLHECVPDCRIVVGGAVLTKAYAAQIGADFYAADAMETVRIAENFFAHSP